MCLLLASVLDAFGVGAFASVAAFDTDFEEAESVLASALDTLVQVKNIVELRVPDILSEEWAAFAFVV